MSTADVVPHINEYSLPTSRVEWVEYMNVKSTPNLIVEPKSLELDFSSVFPNNIQYPTSTYSIENEEDDFVIPFSPNRRYIVNAKIIGVHRWSPKAID